MSDKPLRGLYILVVDDSVDSAEALRMLLGALGHEALLAHSGTEAVESALARTPDVILLDLALPDISGYEVARRLRRDPALTRTRLVGLSGFGGDVHRQRCLEAGFDDYLEKPVEVSVLSTVLARPR